MNTKSNQPTVQELREVLTEAFSVKCPVCGSQWSFEIKTPKSWLTHRTCGCKEYEELIELRTREVYARLAQHRQ